MAYNIITQSGKISTYLTEYVCDEESDIVNLPIDAVPGSTCVVISSSEVYMLNTKKEWIKL